MLMLVFIFVMLIDCLFVLLLYESFCRLLVVVVIMLHVAIWAAMCLLFGGRLLDVVVAVVTLCVCMLCWLL